MRSTKKINKIFRSSSLWTCLHLIVILKSRNKITDFLKLLAWVWAFKDEGRIQIKKHTQYSTRLEMYVHRSLTILNITVTLSRSGTTSYMN